MTPLILAAMVLLGATEGVAPDVELAEAIATVSALSPLPGEHGRERMAAVLVAIAWHESRFDVDALGDCKDPAHRTPATCASWGPFQINRGWARTTPGVEGEAELAARGLSGSDLRAAAMACARRAIMAAPPPKKEPRSETMKNGAQTALAALEGLS